MAFGIDDKLTQDVGTVATIKANTEQANQPTGHIQVVQQFNSPGALTSGIEGTILPGASGVDLLDYYASHITFHGRFNCAYIYFKASSIGALFADIPSKLIVYPRHQSGPGFPLNIYPIPLQPIETYKIGYEAAGMSDFGNTNTGFYPAIRIPLDYIAEYYSFGFHVRIESPWAGANLLMINGYLLHGFAS